MDKDKDFKFGLSQFEFPNGDKYIGNFCAHRSGLVWRQGHGIYFTHDGQVYEGEWKDDKVNEQENLEITFQNGDKFIGKVAKFKYNGAGSYFFSNGTRLTCNFVDNKPAGEIIFIDHRDRCWSGIAGDEYVLLYTEHIFSYELDSERGKGEAKYPKVEIVEEKGESLQGAGASMQEMERRIFHKSLKTPSEIDWFDSDWVREHEEFTEMCERVLPKIVSGRISELTQDEFAWYMQFKKNIKRAKRKKKKLPRISCNLLKRFYSEKYKNSCPPVRVFYPTPVEEYLADVDDG